VENLARLLHRGIFILQGPDNSVFIIADCEDGLWTILVKCWLKVAKVYQAWMSEQFNEPFSGHIKLQYASFDWAGYVQKFVLWTP
jgi:hypothetical protein